jgi:TIR domain
MPRDDVEIEIRFDFADIPSDALTENYAVGWVAGRWEQYYFIPTPDIWGGSRPIFLAAQEAILHEFGLGAEAVNLESLSTASPTILQGLGCAPREEPFYTVARVTSFVEWFEGGGSEMQATYRAERLQLGEWIVARLEAQNWRWIEEARRLSDLDLWKLLADGRRYRLLAGRPRSFRWKSIFLAHSSADKDFVRKLAERLRALAVRVWVDEAEINVGDSLFGRIEAGIEGMDFVGVVLSPSSVASPWFQEEVRMAMAAQLAKGTPVVLPLLLKDTQIPGFLREKRYADFRDPSRHEATLDDLLRRLKEEFGSGS